MNFAEAGLHVIRIRAGEAGAHLQVEVRACGETSAAEIARIVRKDGDGVVTGSGDASADSPGDGMTWKTSCAGICPVIWERCLPFARFTGGAGAGPAIRTYGSGWQSS